MGIEGHTQAPMMGEKYKNATETIGSLLQESEQHTVSIGEIKSRLVEEGIVSAEEAPEFLFDLIIKKVGVSARGFSLKNANQQGVSIAWTPFSVEELSDEVRVSWGDYSVA